VDATVVDEAEIVLSELVSNAVRHARPLADGSILDDHFSAMGGWISSTLVRVGDLKWDFLPPLDLDEP
jgi:hypothetical protein